MNNDEQILSFRRCGAALRELNEAEILIEGTAFRPQEKAQLVDRIQKLLHKLLDLSDLPSGRPQEPYVKKLLFTIRSCFGLLIGIHLSDEEAEQIEEVLRHLYGEVQTRRKNPPPIPVTPPQTHDVAP